MSTRNKSYQTFNNMFETNPDIHSYHTRTRTYFHYFWYHTGNASKGTRHAIPNVINELPPLVHGNVSTLNLEQYTDYYKSFIIDSYEDICRIHQCYICNDVKCNGIYWGKVVNLSIKSTVKWIPGYCVTISLSFINHPFFIAALSSSPCDLPPPILSEYLERDLSTTYFCINTAYACACYLTYFLVASVTTVHRNRYGSLQT